MLGLLRFLNGYVWKVDRRFIFHRIGYNSESSREFVTNEEKSIIKKKIINQNYRKYSRFNYKFRLSKRLMKGSNESYEEIYLLRE